MKGKMKIDIETLEHHHNALQVSFNLLLLSLTKHQPDIVEEWLSTLFHTIDTEDSIPEKQRELMQGQFLVLAEHMEDIKKQKTKS